MLRSSTGAAALSLLALIQCSPAFADDSLAEIVVAASRVGTRLDEMPLHTTVLTREQIELSPAPTPDELLRYVPSLLLPGAPSYVTDPTGHNVKFRGMDKKVLVLVDGVPVLDPFYTTLQWFKVPSSSIERVEVVRGGGSSLWGNLAVGGVINFVTRRPERDSGELSASFASQQTWNAAAHYGFVLSDTLSLTLSADAFGTDGYNTVPRASRSAFYPGRSASSAERENVRAALYWEPSDTFRSFLRIGYHEQDERIGGYEYGRNLQRSPDLQAGVAWRLGWGADLNANAYAQHVSFDKFNGAGCYAAATYACGAAVGGSGATTTQQAAPVLQYASSFDLLRYRERGGSVMLGNDRVGLLRQWQLGIDFRQVSGSDAQRTFRTPSAALPQVLRVQRTNDGRGQQTFLGAFAQTKWQPVERFDVILSARIDRFGNTDGSAVQTNYSNVATPVAATPTGGAVPDLTQTRFDPSVAVRYELARGVALRGSVYKAFRAPGLNNLYRSFGSSSISIANPLLKPETLTGGEVGVDWRAGRAYGSVTAFDADVKDVVATYRITTATPVPDAVRAICGATYNGTPNPSCPGTVSFYTNGQDQNARGVELTAGWSAGRPLRVDAFATWTRTDYTRTLTGDPTDVQLPVVPKYVGGVSFTWRPVDALSISGQARYNSAMTLGSLTQSPLLRQGGYTVANLGATYRLRANTDVGLAVTNVGGKVYTDSSASNPQGFTLAAPRMWSFDVRVRL